MSSSNINDALALTRLSKDEFESVYNPFAMGNTANIAYGGCSIGIAAAAACQTVGSQYHAYSLMGNYLGPALIDRKFFCTVKRIRDTRTFATRHVEVSQKQNNGSQRVCLFMTADFHVREPVDVLTFSAIPTVAPKTWRVEKTPEQWRQELLDQGKIDAKTAKLHEMATGTNRGLFEQRNGALGLSRQIMSAIAKTLPTEQDHLLIADQTLQQWVKSATKLSAEEQTGAITLFMDGALSFIPLLFDHKWVTDAGACSSLDFAMRIYDDAIDFNEWHLHEMKAISGALGRTYSEARLWNESGKLVATMSQQSILRPKPAFRSKEQSKL